MSKRSTSARSAEFHSAVSQIFNLRRSRRIGDSSSGEHAADCKSAIRQSETLRYEEDLDVYHKRIGGRMRRLRLRLYWEEIQ